MATTAKPVNPVRNPMAEVENLQQFIENALDLKLKVPALSLCYCCGCSEAHALWLRRAMRPITST